MTRWCVFDVTADEAGELLAVVDRARVASQEMLEETLVFHISLYSDRISDLRLLSLATIFDRVLLATRFDIDKANRGTLVPILQGLNRSGAIRPVDLYLSPGRSTLAEDYGWAHGLVRFDDLERRVFEGREPDGALVRIINAIGEYEQEEAVRSWRRDDAFSRIGEAVVATEALHERSVDRFFRLYRQLIDQELMAYMLGADLAPEPEFSALGGELWQATAERSSNLVPAAKSIDEVTRWLERREARLPVFRQLEEVMEFRDRGGCIQFDELVRSNPISSDGFSQQIDERIKRAHRAARRSPELAALGGGALATLGGLAGGTIGAIAGGLVAAAVEVSMARLARQSPWTALSVSTNARGPWRSTGAS